MCVLKSACVLRAFWWCLCRSVYYESSGQAITTDYVCGCRVAASQDASPTAAPIPMPKRRSSDRLGGSGEQGPLPPRTAPTAALVSLFACECQKQMGMRQQRPGEGLARAFGAAEYRAYAVRIPPEHQSSVPLPVSRRDAEGGSNPRIASYDFYWDNYTCTAVFAGGFAPGVSTGDLFAGQLDPAAEDGGDASVTIWGNYRSFLCRSGLMPQLVVVH